MSFHFSDKIRNVKICKECTRPLPQKYEEDLCPTCKENALFRDVKDYIMSHDVTEYDVANYFQIPLGQVRAWIREGRIDYKTHNVKKESTSETNK